MNIRIMSRHEMQVRMSVDPKLTENFKIISINDPEDPILFGNTNEKDYGHLFSNNGNVLSVVFHDISISHANYILFNQDHAVQIIEFLEKLEPKDNLLIHCYMGISRSGAVGTFAREMFNLDYGQFRNMNRQIVPNTHILKLLTETYQEMYDKPHIEHLQ